MPFNRFYSLSDPTIAHLNTTISALTDPFILSRYVGLVSVTAVTVYELCVKDIFYRFSQNKHKILGSFVSKHFERLNGRIKLNDIKKDYLPRFGDIYVNKFCKKLDRLENSTLISQNKSICSSYGNLITWRHQFAHEGNFNTTVTYQEAVDSYYLGKEVINVLAETMRR